MNAKIVSTREKTFRLQVTVSYEDAMLNAEEQLQKCLNDVGSLATVKLLEYFDTNGTPIKICDTTLTSKGREENEYQSPYGGVSVNRHVYQTSKGGNLCPFGNRE